MPASEIPQLHALAKAVDNLTYPSESDEPFEVVHWPGGTNRSAAQALAEHAAVGRRISYIPVEQFFSELEDSDEANRFQALRGILESELRDPIVCRVGEGEVEVDVYILGRLPIGDWAGLHVRSVET